MAKLVTSVNTKNNHFCFLTIFLCFFLTSAGYLSWLYHLITIIPNSTSVDRVTMIWAYFSQAAGILLFSLMIRFNKRLSESPAFTLILMVYMILLIPSVLSGDPLIAILFGLVSNLFCGIIAGYYLFSLLTSADQSLRATLFGSAYGLATIVLWLLSLTGKDIYSDYSLIMYALLTVTIAGLYRIKSIPIKAADPSESAKGNPEAGQEEKTFSVNPVLILTAALTVVLMSLVKNLGFTFLSSDLTAGINLEFTRTFYGCGLIIAGVVSDRSRKYGAVFCLSSLVLPFVMIILAGQSIPGLILWSLNYFFYGFFSVFRVILFIDIADRSRCYPLAALGLFSGRIGDAGGTLIQLVTGGDIPLLVIITATLFILTVFLFFRLYQQIYLPSPGRIISQEQIFESFSSAYRLSARERDVMRLVLKEVPTPQIAQELFISESTVKFHIHNLLKKTGAKNRIALLTLYHKTVDSSSPFGE